MDTKSFDGLPAGRLSSLYAESKSQLSFDGLAEIPQASDKTTASTASTSPVTPEEPPVAATDPAAVPTVAHRIDCALPIKTAREDKSWQ